MIALVRYITAVVLHSQRFLPPLMLFAGVAIMFVAGTGTSPVVGTYGAVAGVLFACSTWFTLVLVAAEDPVRREITAVNAGGFRRVLIATVLVALAGCLLVSGVLLVSAPLFAAHPIGAAELAAGFLAQFTAASTGIAAGLVSSRLVLPRAGHSVLAALALVAIFALGTGLPPVNPTVRLLANTSDAPDALAGTAAYAGVALLLLIGGTVVAHLVSTRRD